MAIWLVEPINGTQGEAHFINTPEAPAIDNPAWQVSGPYASYDEAAEYLEAGESL